LVPYTGGAVDDRGRPPGPWDLTVNKTTDFEERMEEMPVPHTEQVRPCERCDSRGRMTCTQCQGFGKVPCPWCHGTGYRTRTEMRNVPDQFGNTVMKAVEVRDNCTCFQGKVGCSACGGQCTVVCGDCRGNGRVKIFEHLTVHFRVDSQVEVIHATTFWSTNGRCRRCGIRPLILRWTTASQSSCTIRSRCTRIRPGCFFSIYTSNR
jgi:hypothetical protein